MSDNTVSDDMNDDVMNGGATEGASSDGDLDFQGDADATGETAKGCGTEGHACGCGKKEATDDPANDFPKSQEPSGDGSGIRAGGEQAE